MLLEAFIRGDVHIDFPFEEAKFRFDKKSGKVYRRFYGQTEVEIPPSSALYHEAIGSGEQITPEEYLLDPACKG
jgi:hypothetical protein